MTTRATRVNSRARFGGVQLVALVISLTVILTAAPSGAVTRYVSNMGADSILCGASATPCRSITQAISNSVDGDRIVVAPGVYGEDLDQDGGFDAGDEAAPLLCSCVVLVDKRVTIESRDGARVTLIRASAGLKDVVRVMYRDVVFGKPSKGFTLMGGRKGLVIASPATGVDVRGNVVRDNQDGGIVVAGAGENTVRDNRIEDNGSTFEVGLEVSGSNNLVRGNVISRNGTGIMLSGDGHTVEKNTIVNNFYHGVNVSSGNTTISSNAIIGNYVIGVVIGAAATATVMRNSIFGNAWVGTNCGINNQSGWTIDARQNFWGSASGPGLNPADGVCGTLGASTTTDPFVTKEIKVRARALK